MSKLYSSLAGVYHAMYAKIFDYAGDFHRVDAVLRRHRCQRVLEMGCGDGSLAPYFLARRYDYTGMDAAPAMLAMARRRTPEARFRHGDMRRFTIPRAVDAVVMIGRSFAYMTSNQDVQRALACLRRALRPGGILLFDNFDAEAIFRRLGRHTHRVQSEGVRYTRRSLTSAKLSTGWTWNWDAVYVIEQRGRKRAVRDHTVLRAFTPDELRLFLSLAGFKPVRITRRDGVIVSVAQRSSRKTA